MSNTAKSIYYYSFYLFAIGLGMIAIPNVLLGLFGFSPTNEIWIRMLGLFTLTVGIYYLYSSRKEQVEFFKATVMGRLFFFVGTCLLVLFFVAPPTLILIGSVDLVGAIFTLAALHN